MVKMPSLKELLDAGVHIGHKTARWHPKMKPFIFMAKNSVHIINLEKTEEKLKEAIDFLAKASSEGKEIVFVGTKKQSSAIIEKAAKFSNTPYVNHRWVGGVLTNYGVVSVAIANFKKEKEELESNAENLSKKELAKLRIKVENGEKIFGGLTNLTKKPEILILIGSHDEKNAICEARIGKIDSIGIVDTNSDPNDVTFSIPGNDDATKSIELFANLFAEVIKTNKPKVVEQK
jgi:small subunit ribosomal protein S2